MGLRVSVLLSRVLGDNKRDDCIHLMIFTRLSIMCKAYVQAFQSFITKPQNCPERWGLL